MTRVRTWLTASVFLHLLLTFIMAWWCFILALPGSTFATSPAYAGFAWIMSEDWWAFATGCVAALGLCGLRWRRARASSEIALSIAHGLISMTVVASVPLSTATGVYAALMVSAWYLIWWNRNDV